MKRIVDLFLLMILSLTMVQGNAQDSILIKKVAKLEGEVAVLKDSLNAVKATFEAENILIKESKALLNEFAQSPAMFILKYGSLFLGIIAFLIVVFFGVLNKVAKDWYVNLIQKWIDRYERTNTLKREKKILVISSEEFENKDFIYKFFKRMKFEKVVHKRLGEAEEALRKDIFNVILANNEDAELPQEKLEELITKNENCVLFYFGKSQSWDFRKYKDLKAEPPFLKRLNIANSRAQLYGNLLSTLNYHETF